jgi:hypothetical protein
MLAFAFVATIITLSKVFADPVWYFYSFWFPQYLKVGHGFTMKEIGQTAWISFFAGGIGNLAGGFLCSGLLRFGLSPQIARRVLSLVTGWLVDHYSFKPAFVLFGLTPIIAACLVWWLPRTIAPEMRVPA